MHTNKTTMETRGSGLCFLLVVFWSQLGRPDVITQHLCSVLSDPLAFYIHRERWN